MIPPHCSEKEVLYFMKNKPGLPFSSRLWTNIPPVAPSRKQEKKSRAGGFLMLRRGWM
jgi:hypothetical protein